MLPFPALAFVRQLSVNLLRALVARAWVGAETEELNRLPPHDLRRDKASSQPVDACGMKRQTITSLLHTTTTRCLLWSLCSRATMSECCVA